VKAQDDASLCNNNHQTFGPFGATATASQTWDDSKAFLTNLNEWPDNIAAYWNLSVGTNPRRYPINGLVTVYTASGGDVVSPSHGQTSGTGIMYNSISVDYTIPDYVDRAIINYTPTSGGVVGYIFGIYLHTVCMKEVYLGSFTGTVNSTAAATGKYLNYFVGSNSVSSDTYLNTLALCFYTATPGKCSMNGEGGGSEEDGERRDDTGDYEDALIVCLYCTLFVPNQISTTTMPTASTWNMGIGLLGSACDEWGRENG
jgi:hypothetical protein